MGGAGGGVDGGVGVGSDSFTAQSIEFSPEAATTTTTAAAAAGGAHYSCTRIPYHTIPYHTIHITYSISLPTNLSLCVSASVSFSASLSL